MYYCGLCFMEIFSQYSVRLGIKSISVRVCLCVYMCMLVGTIVYERAYMHTCKAFETGHLDIRIYGYKRCEHLQI